MHFILSIYFPPFFAFLHVVWPGCCLACRLSNAAPDHTGPWRDVPIHCPIVPGMKEVGFTHECTQKHPGGWNKLHIQLY